MRTPPPGEEDDWRWIPPHRSAPEGTARRAAITVLGVTGIWGRLPGRAKSALCGCAEFCRDPSHQQDPR